MEKKLRVKNEELRIVEGIIAEPFKIDTDSEFHFLKGITQMYSQFILDGMEDHVDLEHDRQKTGSHFIRSFIAHADDPDGYPRGAWVGCCKVAEDVWPKVLSGEINGYSVDLSYYALQVQVVADVLVTASGTTEQSTANDVVAHTHTVTITFDSLGKVITCYTDYNEGHRHLVTRATATELCEDHGHRLLILQ